MSPTVQMWLVVGLCVAIAVYDPAARWQRRQRARRFREALDALLEAEEEGPATTRRLSQIREVLAERQAPSNEVAKPATPPLAAFFGIEVLVDRPLAPKQQLGAAVQQVWRSVARLPRASA